MRIYCDAATKRITDSGGISLLPASEHPGFFFGSNAHLEIQFFSDGAALALTDGDTFVISLDNNFLHTDELMAQSTSVSIVAAGAGRIALDLDLRSSSFETKLGGKETISAWLEVTRIRAGETVGDVLLQDTVIAHNRVQTVEPSPPVPAVEYYTVPQIHALLRAGLECEYSDDLTAWSSTQESRVYMRFRNRELGGEWSDPCRIRGADGNPGAAATVNAGTLTLLEPGATPQVSNSGTSQAAVFNFSIPRAANGNPGAAATVDAGTLTLLEPGETPQVSNSGTSQAAVFNFSIPRAENGKDLDWDKVGDPAELSLYNDREAGFRFAASVVDADAKTNTIFIWKKASAASADWMAPLVLVRYSIAGRNADLIPPVEFTAPSGSGLYLELSMASNTSATIAAVCVDTSEGELRLPYNSATGILRIVRNVSANTVKIYFGANVPSYTKGRIYFAQGVTYVMDLMDAPADGKTYARCNGEWVEVSAAAEDSSDGWDNIVDPGNYSDDLAVVG